MPKIAGIGSLSSRFRLVFQVELTALALRPLWQTAGSAELI
jgi:hypothetical protein